MSRSHSHSSREASADGEPSPKRRRVETEGEDAHNARLSPSRATAISTPGWSPITASTPAQPNDEDSPTTHDEAFLRDPRPLPRQRAPLSVTPSLAGTPRQTSPDLSSFLQSPRQRPSLSRSPSVSGRSNTPATHNEDHHPKSSPVPSHATLPDVETKQQPTGAVHYRPELILRGHKRAVSAVKFSPDGNWIASCSSDATARIWSAHTGAPIHTLTGHLAGLSCLAWSPDSLTLATGSDDKSIRLWSALTGRPHPTPLLGHHNHVYSLSFSPSGNMLVSGSYDEAVFLWDVRTGRVMRSLPAHSDPVGGVDFSADGTLVVSCSSDGLIRVWDTASGQCLRTFFHEDTPPVVSVRFSPNGRFIATWMLDSSVRMWNYVEGRCVKTYKGHVNARYSLQGAIGTYGGGGGGDGAGNKDETEGGGGEGEEQGKAGKAMVASGSEDGAIFLWDVNSKAVLQRLEGHVGPVMGVDVDGTGMKIVSCGMDKTIRLWRDSKRGREKSAKSVKDTGGVNGY